jgi:hypothetical protein
LSTTRAGFSQAKATELEDQSKNFKSLATEFKIEPGSLGKIAIASVDRGAGSGGDGGMPPVQISDVLTERATKSLRSIGVQVESQARNRTVFLDPDTGRRIAVLFGGYAVALLPAELSVSQRAYAINAFAAAERVQTGDRIIVPLGREQDQIIARIEQAMRNAMASMSGNTKLTRLEDGFLVFKPGGEQVLAAVPTRRNKLLYADNYTGDMRRAEYGILPPDMVRDVRVRNIMEKRRQERLGFPHSTRAVVRAQFATGQLSTGIPGDFRGGRDIDRRAAFGPW